MVPPDRTNCRFRWSATKHKIAKEITQKLFGNNLCVWLHGGNKATQIFTSVWNMVVQQNLPDQQMRCWAYHIATKCNINNSAQNSQKRMLSQNGRECVATKKKDQRHCNIAFEFRYFNSQKCRKFSHSFRPTQMRLLTWAQQNKHWTSMLICVIAQMSLWLQKQTNVHNAVDFGRCGNFPLQPYGCISNEDATKQMYDCTCFERTQHSFDLHIQASKVLTDAIEAKQIAACRLTNMLYLAGENTS